MYSGYILIYGIELAVWDVISLFNLNEEDEDDIYFIHDFVNDILVQNNFNFIKFIKKPCCYHEKFSVYIAVNLGCNQVQYKSNVECFDDFQIYNDFFKNKLNIIRNYYLKNKDEIMDEFNRFYRIFLGDTISYESKPYFFTIPDDCECN